MKRREWIKYPYTDARLRWCSMAARGLHAHLLCIGHDGAPYGYLRRRGKNLSSEDIAGIFGGRESVETIERLTAELLAVGLLGRDNKGIFCKWLTEADDDDDGYCVGYFPVASAASF